MKIEERKTAMSKEELYQVGNVIKWGGRFYLVIDMFNGNKYALLDLKDNSVCSRIYDSLEDLSEACYSDETDQLVRAKVVID